MLRIFYRYCPEDRVGIRPTWFSKRLCLASFALSVRNHLDRNRYGDEVEWRIFIDKTDALSVQEKEIIYSISLAFKAKVDYLSTNSNAKSYLYILEEARVADDNDRLLFVEDDYMWVTEAVYELIDAIDNINGADYLTPYDHPVRYDEEYRGGADLPHWENTIFLRGNRHYRSQESTCMTFMTSGKIIKKDFDLHRKYSLDNEKCPNDRELFRHLQRLGKYPDAGERRLLLGPMPSLATHAHMPFLAPIIDWEKPIEEANQYLYKLITST